MPEKTRTSLLVVDDESSIRDTFSLLLTRTGYSVRAAENGLSAWTEIQEQIPDMILSDLNMPGMSGYELVAAVRRRHPSIPFIAMSGAYSGDGVPSGIAADAFYRKGSGVPALLAIIDELAHRGRPQANGAPRGEAQPRRASSAFLESEQYGPDGSIADSGGWTLRADGDARRSVSAVSRH